MLMKMNKNRKTGTGLIYQPTKVQALSISKGALMLFQKGFWAPFKIDSTLAINNIAFKYFSRRISRFSQADLGPAGQGT